MISTQIVTIRYFFKHNNLMLKIIFWDFFSILFIDFLTQIPPFKQERFDLRIGFPFTYFYELYPSGGFNHAWNLINLFLDSFIVWLIILTVFLIFKKIKSQ